MAPILDIEVECGEQKSRLLRGMVVLRGTVNYCIWTISFHANHVTVRLTAVVNSIDRSTEHRAPIRCLPFDGIGARHPG